MKPSFATPLALIVLFFGVPLLAAEQQNSAAPPPAPVQPTDWQGAFQLAVQQRDAIQTQANNAALQDAVTMKALEKQISDLQAKVAALEKPREAPPKK